MMPTWAKAILTSPKFWTAFLAVVQTILFQFVPNFPSTVWQVLDALAVTVIGIMFASDIKNLKSQVTQLLQTVNNLQTIVAGLRQKSK